MFLIEKKACNRWDVVHFFSFFTTAEFFKGILKSFFHHSLDQTASWKASGNKKSLLTAWLVSGQSQRVQRFQRQLKTSSPALGQQERDKRTSPPGRSFVAGVKVRNLIQFRLLKDLCWKFWLSFLTRALSTEQQVSHIGETWVSWMQNFRGTQECVSLDERDKHWISILVSRPSGPYKILKIFYHFPILSRIPFRTLSAAPFECLRMRSSDMNIENATGWSSNGENVRGNGMSEQWTELTQINPALPTPMAISCLNVWPMFDLVSNPRPSSMRIQYIFIG